MVEFGCASATIRYSSVLKPPHIPGNQYNSSRAIVSGT